MGASTVKESRRDEDELRAKEEYERQLIQELLSAQRDITSI